MRKIVGILVILSCASVLMGCTGKTIEASLDKEFTLAIGQTASISSENLKIKFMDVTADSRCPSDVQCVWAGEVKVLLNIADKDSSQKIEMVQPSLTGHKVGAYSYQFTVEPYPISTEEIKKDDYRLKMTVSKP